MATDVLDMPSKGFQFDNFLRNEKLYEKGHKIPIALKTGTTIAGCIFKDGVVLGADTRATAGYIIADKKSDKIHYVQPNMYCAGAGTAADLDMTPSIVSGNLELHKLNTGRQVQVATANRMLRQMLFRYQGHISAYLILGGVDKHGPHIYSIMANGYGNKSPYNTLGSGSLAAMSVLEMKWKPDLEMEEAKQLIREAIHGGVYNDLGSGNSIDLMVITKDGATRFRPVHVVAKQDRFGKYDYKKGTTEVLSTTVKPVEIVSETIRRTTSGDDDEMDTA